MPILQRFLLRVCVLRIRGCYRSLYSEYPQTFYSGTPLSGSSAFSVLNNIKVIKLPLTSIKFESFQAHRARSLPLNRAFVIQKHTLKTAEHENYGRAHFQGTIDIQPLFTPMILSPLQFHRSTFSLSILDLALSNVYTRERPWKSLLKEEQSHQTRFCSSR